MMRMIGYAATKCKERLDMIYGDRLDDDGRRFIGLHETVMPLCSVARSIFQQLRGSTAKKSKQPAAPGTAPKINGRPNGRITGVDMRHLLLLLPFLLFDLLEDEIEQYNATNGTSLINPCHKLIAWVLVLLEWYHLYRRSVPGDYKHHHINNWKYLNILCNITVYFVIL